MRTTAYTWNIKTTLLTATFAFCLLSATALQLLIHPHSALAYSDTYPTSINNCRLVGPPVGPYTNCDLKDDTQDKWYDPWSEENRECTSYVAWMLSSVNGFTMPFNANAVDWKTKAQNLGYTVNMTPAVGSIWWSPNPTNVGHVAYVQSVSSDGTHVDTTDYNSDYTGHWNQELNIATSSASGYIHFKDVANANTVKWSGNFSLTWTTGRLDAIAPEPWSNGAANTDHIYYNNGWSAWDAPLSIGSQITSWPAAVSWGSGRIDVFARDTAGHLTQAYYTDTGGWHNWNNSPFSTSCITGAPGVSSWGTNRLDVFAQGCGDNGASLNHWWWDGTSWHAETLPITGQLFSAPAATSWGTNRIDVFAQGPNGVLEQAYYDGTSWHGWNTSTFSGSCITGAPGVSTWGVNRLDVFAQGCGDNGANTNHVWFNGAWQPWATLPNSQQITSSPSASSALGSNRIDLFARDANGHLIQRYYDTAGWHNWVSLGGTLGN